MADIKRVNYFTHQFLVEKDFDDEQAYHIDMRHRHNRVNHSWGVADGLDAGKTGDKEITISSGSAIDKDGREIVLLESAPVDLTAFGAGTDVYLVIAYQEIFETADHYTSGGVDNYTRTTERPNLSGRTTVPPGDGSVITLARIHLDSSGNIDGINNTVRTLVGSKIAPGTVDTNELADSSVTNTKLANNSINAAKIADGSVSTAELANSAVTEQKLSNNAVSSAKIADNAVTAAKIANAQVGTSELADSSVTNAKLANNSVNAATIADGSVSTAELANNAVPLSKLKKTIPYNSTYSVSANGTFNVNLAEGDDEHAFYLVSVYCITVDARITWEWGMTRYTVSRKTYFNRRIVVKNQTNIAASFRIKIYRILEN